MENVMIETVYCNFAKFSGDSSEKIHYKLNGSTCFSIELKSYRFPKVDWLVRRQTISTSTFKEK